MILNNASVLELCFPTLAGGGSLVIVKKREKEKKETVLGMEDCRYLETVLGMEDCRYRETVRHGRLQVSRDC